MGANKHAVIPGALINLLREDPITAVLTGAGISAESGVPTFREAQTGLWAQFDPQELATPQAFQKDPKLVWEWYQWRRELVNQDCPKPGTSRTGCDGSPAPRFQINHPEHRQPALSGWQRSNARRAAGRTSRKYPSHQVRGGKPRNEFLARDGRNAPTMPALWGIVAPRRSLVRGKRTGKRPKRSP